MEIQNQVSRILRDNLARLRDVLDGAVSQGVGSLGQVADRVCEAFDFRDGRGRWQRASCCRALSDLQAAGHVSLPAGRGARGGGGRARVLPHPLAPAVDVPGTVGAVVGLTLELVETDEQRQVWNTLMAYEHPRGAGPFVGPQLRYLVGSAHGWLGGVGFAASARRLRARDAWVGWDDTGRRAHLHRVLGLCRLLVRPGVACRNLASHVLGRVVRAVGDDCERRYGYRPWLLETFVDETEQTGASVRAANWVRVGETCGRGRQDRTHAAPETRKAVYMYALEPAWRTRLAVPAPVVAPLAVGDGLDAAVWAEHEFGGARLGDARLSARLVHSAQHMAESPMRAITGAAHGARAMVKGHYRLIDQPADSAVTVGNILAPHREQTLRRMQAHDTVLCIQDGTRLNFTRRGQTQGLGAIGSNQTGAVARGLELHTTLAVNPDGVALGVLRAAFDAPASPNSEAEGEPTPKPREKRKSFRWIEGLRDCAQAAEQLSQTRVVCVMDREADFLDLFVEHRAAAPQVDLLVRAKADRVLGREKTPDGQTVSRRLFDTVRNAPARGAAKVEVQRLSARVKASKQARKDRRAERVADVTHAHANDDAGVGVIQASRRPADAQGVQGAGASPKDREHSDRTEGRPLERRGAAVPGKPREHGPGPAAMHGRPDVNSSGLLPTDNQRPVCRLGDQRSTAGGARSLRADQNQRSARRRRGHRTPGLPGRGPHIARPMGDREPGAALLRRRPNQSLRQRGRRQLDPSRRGEGAAEGTGGRWYLCRQRRLGVFRWYSRAWWRVSVRINAPAARGGLRTVATAAKCHRAPVDYHPVAGQMPRGLQ